MIFEALKSEDHFAELGIESCLGSIELQWTDNMANSMKEKMKSQLADTEFERTNDLDTYCDCLIEEYRKHPLSKITEDGFNKSELSLRIDSICTVKSHK